MEQDLIGLMVAGLVLLAIGGSIWSKVQAPRGCAVRAQPVSTTRIWTTKVPQYELDNYPEEFRRVTGKEWFTWVVRDEDGRSSAIGHHLAADKDEVIAFAEGVAAKMRREVERPGRREKELNPGPRLAGKMLEFRTWSARQGA